MVTHNWLDGLLNGGADTVDTQPGGAVKGVDDARTVIINGNTWVLPTIAELHALYGDPTVDNPPAGWYGGSFGFFWSSTQSGSDYHYNETMYNGVQYSNGDTVTHDWLDGLLNGGADTVDTQSGGAVKGVDDARTVIINGNTWVLPTLAELHALYNDPAVANPLAGWYNNGFWSSTRSGSGFHDNESVHYGYQGSYLDTTYTSVAFQVL